VLLTEIAGLAKGIVSSWMDKVKEKGSSDSSTSKHSGESWKVTNNSL
jgi:hypothetical protein